MDEFYDEPRLLAFETKELALECVELADEMFYCDIVTPEIGMPFLRDLRESVAE